MCLVWQDGAFLYKKIRCWQATNWMNVNSTLLYLCAFIVACTRLHSYKYRPLIDRLQKLLPIKAEGINRYLFGYVLGWIKQVPLHVEWRNASQWFVSKVAVISTSRIQVIIQPHQKQTYEEPMKKLSQFCFRILHIWEKKENEFKCPLSYTYLQ